MGREKLCQPLWIQACHNFKDGLYPSRAHQRVSPSRVALVKVEANSQRPATSPAAAADVVGSSSGMPTIGSPSLSPRLNSHEDPGVEVIDDAWAVRKLAEIRRRSRAIGASSVVAQNPSVATWNGTRGLPDGASRYSASSGIQGGQMEVTTERGKQHAGLFPMVLAIGREQVHLERCLMFDTWRMLALSDHSSYIGHQT